MRVAPAVEADAGRGKVLANRGAVAVGRVRPGTGRVLIFTHDLSYGGGQLWLSELLRQMSQTPAPDCAVVSIADGPLRSSIEDLGIPVQVPPRVGWTMSTPTRDGCRNWPC